MLFWALGTSKWTQKDKQKPQVGWMYVPMSKLKNKPLTKLLGPKENIEVCYGKF
jgi:hypothetical protein